MSITPDKVIPDPVDLTYQQGGELPAVQGESFFSKYRVGIAVGALLLFAVAIITTCIFCIPASHGHSSNLRLS